MSSNGSSITCLVGSAGSGCRDHGFRLCFANTENMLDKSTHGESFAEAPEA